MAFDVIVENKTSISVDTHVQIDGAGQEILLLMWSATFNAPPGGKLELIEDQAPIRFADVPYRDPENSSIRYEADIATRKEMVDVVINGSAYAPNGSVAQKVNVGLRIADINKTLIVTGDRRWSFLRHSSPKPFRSMPIVYERAYGGTNSKLQCDIRNPVGVGYRGAQSSDPAVETEIANIEYPKERIRRASNHPRPAGFGVVGRWWTPRLKYAGTYDQNWLDNHWPLLPGNFNSRYYQAAPEDQQSRLIRGGEPIELLNLTSNGTWRFRIPKIDLPIKYRFDDRIEYGNGVIDTILLEPDSFQLIVSGRSATKTIRNTPRLREIIVGHVSKAWLKARESGKKYVNFKGGSGALLKKPIFL